MWDQDTQRDRKYSLRKKYPYTRDFDFKESTEGSKAPKITAVEGHGKSIPNVSLIYPPVIEYTQNPDTETGADYVRVLIG